MAAARLGYLIGPAAVVAVLERVALPYHLDALKQAAGPSGPALHVGEMEERVALIVRERHRLLAEPGPPAGDGVAVAGQLHPVPAASGARAREVWQGLLDRSVLVRDTSSWPRLADCLRVTVGTPEENDRFLAALAEVLA